MATPTYMSTIPSNWVLYQNNLLSSYMVRIFQHKMGICRDSPPLPRIPLEAICEADRLVDILLQACQNRIKVNHVDIIRLGEHRRGQLQSHPITAEDSSRNEETDLGNLQELSEIDRPAVITDQGGYVMVWYLPGGISKPNQLWNQTGIIAQPLSRSIQNKETSNWRNSRRFFRSDAEQFGAINLSPAWYQQGRDVQKHEPEVSALLKETKLGNGAQRWLCNLHYIGGIIGGALAIMHPEMYMKAWEAMVNLGKWAGSVGNKEMLELLAIWPNVYSVASVMVNWSSPIHLDQHGRPQWLDMLLTFGDYDNLDIMLPTLGMRFRYNPGTIVALSGQLLEHGVGEAAGNQGTISFYMRDNVHEQMEIHRPHHVHFSQIGKQEV